LDACFFNTQDYINFRLREKDMCRQLSLFGKVKPDVLEREDLLGLETRIQRRHRKGRSRDAIYAVIFEQEMTRGIETKSINDEVLAQIYRQFTDIPSRLARERALSNSMQIISKMDSPSNYVNPYSCVPKLEMETAVTMDESCNYAMQDVRLNKKEQSKQYFLHHEYNMMDYAAACIPPTPATLRFGHHHYLEMSQEDDAVPWPQPDQEEEDHFFDSHENSVPSPYDKNGIGPPAPQAMSRDKEQHQNPQIAPQFHCHAPSMMFQEVQKMTYNHSLRRNQYMIHPDQRWVWNPTLCEFVPLILRNR
jgi:hypothetical protein